MKELLIGLLIALIFIGGALCVMFFSGQDYVPNSPAANYEIKHNKYCTCIAVDLYGGQSRLPSFCSQFDLNNYDGSCGLI